MQAWERDSGSNPSPSTPFWGNLEKVPQDLWISGSSSIKLAEYPLNEMKSPRA